MLQRTTLAIQQARNRRNSPRMRHQPTARFSSGTEYVGFRKPKKVVGSKKEEEEEEYVVGGEEEVVSVIIIIILLYKISRLRLR